jgi:hypothetical protein
MKKLILSAVVLAVSLLSVANASPLVVLQTINFDAPGGLGSTNYAGPGADTTLTPLSSGTPEYWNPIVQNGTTSAALASDGATSTAVTFSDTSIGAYFGATPIPAISLFGPRFLFDGSTLTETLNNLTAGTYNLFIYSQNGGFSSHGGTFTINSVSQTVTNAADSSSFVSGTNYTEFTGITLASPGSISFTWDPVGGQGALNGVQLQVLGVPEPSTWAMMLGGVVVLLFVGRLRKNLSI